MFILEISIFAFALWLGLYLISRNFKDLRLLLTGSGLVAYGAFIAIDILWRYNLEAAPSRSLQIWQQWLLFLPALCWLLLLIHVLRGDDAWYSRLRRHQNPRIVLIIATIFFGLGCGLLLFQFSIIPQQILLLGIGIDLFLLGFIIAFLDAFDEGETLLPHFFRSLIFSTLIITLFAGQIALVIQFSSGLTPAMLTLLLSTIAIAIIIQTFSRPLQNLLDRLALVRFPEKREIGITLRETADAIPRRNDEIDLEAMDAAEFSRLTRRALSHMGDLPRLSSSPLTNLPIVETRLQRRGNALDTLERASEFRAILAESIERLKPEDQDQFRSTDSWRHYNALYYPYVLGLKPYSRRLQSTSQNSSYAEAVEWFRSQVPQRTLYNWQNAAAKLVATDLRERSWTESS